MDEIFERIRKVSFQARKTSVLVLFISAIHLGLLILGFYSLNNTLFENLSRYKLKEYSEIISGFSIALFFASVASLYAFSSIRKDAKILLTEVQDELGWYSSNTISSEGKISIDYRIQIRRAAQSMILPFFNQENDIFYYIIFNMMVFLSNLGLSLSFIYQARAIIG